MLSVKFIQEHYDGIMDLLNCLKVGVFITDGKGNVLLLNDESEHNGIMNRKELIGKNMRELISAGYVTESISLKSLKSKNEESMIQQQGDGTHIYITAVPFKNNKNIDLVVCTDRDITETMNLKELLKRQDEKVLKSINELEYLRIQNASGEIIFSGDKMKKVVNTALKIAKSNVTVLITGESGTGKELIANLIYRNSDRNHGPFIKINCGAIPEHLLESELFGYEKGAFTGANKNKIGLFELADNGTLFLDEIAELPMPMQSKLLRVLQEKEIMRIGSNETRTIDVRIIAATNANLKEAIKEKRFREDLFYRLSTIPIEIPPLRDRQEDIEEIAKYFVRHFNMEYKQKKEFLDDAVLTLKNYQWHGNARELRNIIERVFVSCEDDIITSQHIRKFLEESSMTEKGSNEIISGSLDEILENFEKNLLISMLNQYKKASKVSEILTVEKSTLSRKLKKYGIRKWDVMQK